MVKVLCLYRSFLCRKDLFFLLSVELKTTLKNSIWTDKREGLKNWRHYLHEGALNLISCLPRSRVTPSTVPGVNPTTTVYVAPITKYL